MLKATLKTINFVFTTSFSCFQEVKILFIISLRILIALLIVLSLLYPLRRKVKKLNRINKLKFHCIFGLLLLLVSLVHINFKMFTPYFSAGYLSLVALLLIALSGFLKRRFMKIKSLYYIHIVFVSIFILSFFIHIAQQIIYILIM